MLYHLRLQPSEVEKLPFYEYEFIVQNLIDILKEKNEAEKNGYEGQNMDPNSYMKNIKMPKVPNMGNGISNFPKMPSSLKI